MRRWSPRCVAALWLCVLVVAPGCGGIGGSSSGEAPGDVVESALVAANAGQYSEAREYLSSWFLDTWKQEHGASWGIALRDQWDWVTHGGAIDRVEVAEEDIRGETAMVFCTVHYTDGDVAHGSYPMVKEGGKWKMTIEWPTLVPADGPSPQ